MPRPNKSCTRCRERLNPNAFPTGSSTCFACQTGKAKRAKGDMPSMLLAMRGRLDELEKDSDWEHRFITGLIERFESGAAQHLTPRQFEKLQEIYRKYH